jgi:hypothetical protein
MAGPEVVELLATATATAETVSRRDVDVRLTARLDDGRDVVLLERGFGMSASQGPLADPDDEDLRICAWCVGPDEKFDDRNDKDMADAHFCALVEDLRAAGVHTSAQVLMSVPFRVLWGSRERVWHNSLDWY